MSQPSQRWFGTLHVYCIEGEAVHHSYSVYKRRASRQTAYNRVTCGADPCGCNGPDMCWGHADPYCVVDLETGGGRAYRLGRTQTIDNNHNPKWNYEFSAIIDVTEDGGPFSMDYAVSAAGPHLVVRVVDDDMGTEAYDDVLGQCAFPLREATKRGKPLRVSLSLRHPKVPPKTPTISRVKIEFRFYPFEQLPLNNLSVPGTYFRRSHGNMLRLYHDAEVLPGTFPAIPCRNGPHEAHSTWNDIAEAIENAKYFVFIAGWSVNPNISLRRSYVEGEKHPTIGEMLKEKAAQGVQVCVMVWDDITSREGVSWLKDGIMATYDEYVREFFRDTKVDVAVVKRVAADDVGEVSDLLKWTAFTHHQKIVLYDTANPYDNEGRRIVGAFVGGLDLTSGRYDTAEHALWSTINTAHHKDFYNGCLVEATAEFGPREPWHDIHARIEGPAAWDVLQTYIERIVKQAPRLTSSTSLLLNDLRERRKIRDGRKVLIDPAAPQSWDIQVFRSLDTEAALFQNRKWLAKFANTSVYVDRSAHQAYCYLIDRAKKFIYIENQYFLGSAQYWREHDEVPCHNLVPYELTRRICRAIEEGQRFAVYVLMPLFPEGAPGSVSVQEILHWQYQTARFMYHRIGTKLKEVGNTINHPRDYLTFFFVGKREENANPVMPPSCPTDVAFAMRMKQHPIYVHSKMMIVDDEYIIIGSVNINDRSMSGCRDTEIAFGACQPAHQCVPMGNTYQTPQGDIYAFRQQLWYEHLAELNPLFGDASTLDCIRRVNQMAEANLRAFDADVSYALPHGHLCRYPYEITQDGECGPLPDRPNLPGFISPVCGIRSALLPGPLTT
eukprot:Blabericola_migrator_1__10932@NODE_631_length_7153_cov_120_080581_g462_i0_p1_GENE_NODE_631_length_7153_cov_120_080581_g462_i0NODE_631_length_7153_cov_120_080581_g462_i0_p1_ORF_typecomplete_len836_score128_38PLDc_2/PF13091_6/0_0018PLDc_2/PF13091_6/1_7e18PLDc/PF00614_22/1e04PLDc/PF00614_22/5_9e07PLDc/PF00614_22/1e07PLD_C/PF12357_8/4_7e12C2/PF00168_30/1_4e10Regulator_TrmB/PF11495_8/8_8e03Regulator_TrmB/PF11495_8/0_44Regulator_TrmB/PF11495_8/6_8e03Regulator_TrmB/PF11495_8/2_5e02_NODE_631_length_7153